MIEQSEGSSLEVEHSTNVTIRRVDLVDDRSREGFIDTYIDVFAGAPYFEAYEPGYVFDAVWKRHLGHCIVVAEDAGRVIGLACCHPVLADTEPVIRDYLVANAIEVPFDIAGSVFMSELAVRATHRRRGIGKRLIEERFAWAAEMGYPYFIMRTAEEGSNSRKMYERIGAAALPFVQDVSQGDVASASSKRVYLWGQTNT